MTKNERKKKGNMVYSEQFHIPLGQAVKMPTGDYGLRVKKDKNYEIIPVGKLMAQIVQLAEMTT